ncbi:hypothetical protein FSP39_003331 [Pinctada imbricata]|uniref:TLC domain-containing protein n=1 Tax=Pinctada imbricata TaxID=66713 RepID=A0AA88YMY5_PINIB|nr:hypothetical protein FSP39_003331 [Pinctada imbricata]
MASRWIHETLWSEWFWLPDGTNWEDFKSDDPSVHLPNLHDMFLPSILVGLLLLIFRYFNERLVVIPIAKKLGVKVRTPYVLVPNHALEEAYSKNSREKNADIIKGLAKKTCMSAREVERWLRKRSQKDVPSAMQKFTECSWHFIFYSSMFVYGMVILWKKSWFWETKHCWINWPRQHVDRDVYWYYLLEMAFYWSLTFTVLIDHKRKDFTEMVVHHFVTLMLMFFSYGLNFIRVGTLVLVVHDASDFWMAAAKMAKYSKHQSTCEGCFVMFVITWIISRLIIYPFRVIYTSLIEIYYILPWFISHAFFNLLLLVLQVLHIIWSYMIFRILLQKFQHGALKKDVRSDSESQESDDVDENEDDKKDDTEKKNHMNDNSTRMTTRMTTRARSQQKGTM